MIETFDRERYYRNLKTFKSCQQSYDFMSPPEEFCKECGGEITTNCICDDNENEEKYEILY